MFPLNVAYKLVDPKGLPVQVVAVSGTIWNGDVTLKHEFTGQVVAQWQLKGWPLFMGDIKPSFQIDSAELNAKFDASYNPLTNSVEIANLNGFVQSAFINRIAKRNKVKMSGDLEVSNVFIDHSLSETFTHSASGRAVWMGGSVSYPKGRKTGNANLPMLIADFSNNSGELHVDLHTTDNLSVAKASLKTDGWGNVAILKRMIDLVGEPWPNKASADTAVFEISEKVF
jgi:general secretion pathway protein N